MTSISNISPIRPGTLECFEQHFDEWIDSVEKSDELVSEQVKPVSQGVNGFIHSGSYPDITTGQPITNFHPFFPNKDFIASQVMAATYDSNAVPHAVPYLDITTGTPVGKFNFVKNPPPLGKNLNVSV